MTFWVSWMPDLHAFLSCRSPPLHSGPPFLDIQAPLSSTFRRPFPLHSGAPFLYIQAPLISACIRLPSHPTSQGISASSESSAYYSCIITLQKNHQKCVPANPFFVAPAKADGPKSHQCSETLLTCPQKPIITRPTKQMIDEVSSPTLRVKPTIPTSFPGKSKENGGLLLAPIPQVGGPSEFVAHGHECPKYYPHQRP